MYLLLAPNSFVSSALQLLIYFESFFINCQWWAYINLVLTLWGRVTYICVCKLTTVGSDNGLLPGQRQAIFGTNAGILLIGPLATNFSELLIAIETFSCKKMHFKMASGKCWPFYLGLNVLKGNVCHNHLVMCLQLFGDILQICPMFFYQNILMQIMYSTSQGLWTLFRL